MIGSTKLFNRTTINSKKFLLNNKTPCRNFMTRKNLSDKFCSPKFINDNHNFVLISTAGGFAIGIAYSASVNAKINGDAIDKKIIILQLGTLGIVCGFLGGIYFWPILSMNAIGWPSYYIGQKIHKANLHHNIKKLQDIKKTTR